MAKWHGRMGFADTIETTTDVWTETIAERPYYGDVLYDNKSTNRDNEINNGFTIANKISVVADAYARDNFYKAKYITYKGTKWTIGSAEVQYPRLIVSIGGLWNGS